MAKVVRKDKILSGYHGNLETVIIHDASGTPIETTNGVFVTVGDLLNGHAEAKEATLTASGEEGEVFFIHNPEVMYDERKYKLEDYVIKAGKAARAYSLSNGDVITLTEPLFNGSISVGDVLAASDNGLLGQATGSEKVQFKVIRDAGYELHLSEKAFSVQVVR